MENFGNFVGSIVIQKITRANLLIRQLGKKVKILKAVIANYAYTGGRDLFELNSHPSRAYGLPRLCGKVTLKFSKFYSSKDRARR